MVAMSHEIPSLLLLPLIKLLKEISLILSSLSIIIKSGEMSFLSRECIAKLSPHIEFNLNLPPVLGSGKETMHIGL